MKLKVIGTAAGCGCAAAAALIRSGWERRQLKTEHYRIGRSDTPGSALPGKAAGRYRIAFISDMHDYYMFDGSDRVMEVLDAESPDAVLIGGDLMTYIREINRIYDLDNAMELVRRMAERFTVYYGEGNHESKLRADFPDLYYDYKKSLEACGVRFLFNETVFPEGTNGISVSGVSLEYKYYRKLKPGIGKRVFMPEDYIEKRLGKCDETRFNILLMHNPVYFDRAAQWGADLVLSGHQHGGTIRLPFIGGVMSPQYQFFSRECAGVHRKGRSTMIVSRGLGTHSIRIRLNNLPELSIIDIYG